MSYGAHLQDEQSERSYKSRMLIAVVGVFFVLLVIRLIWLQIIDADRNVQMSRDNQMQLRVIKAPRGIMYDRYGHPLVVNRPSYSLSATPYKLGKQKKEVLDRLLKIHDRTGEALFDSVDLAARMRRASWRKFDATRITEDLSPDVLAVIEEHASDFPGLTLEIESRREYSMGSGGFHVLGYISEIPEEQFDKYKEKGYRYGDWIGTAGLERQYEANLRGVDGKEFVEVNAFGKVIGVVPGLPRVEPVSGNALVLTIDEELQKVATKAFPDSLKGAVVVLDPRNGEVLVMYSNPSVDPNIFALSPMQRRKAWASVALDPNLPLNNRAIQGTYSPGSTFKLVTAVAGLETGLVQGSSYMSRTCNGSYRIGGRIAHCWKLEGHGRMNLIGAIRQSCNVYFYQMGIMLGDKNINKYAQLFGMGDVTGIDIPQEKMGWLSGEEAYNQRFSKKKGWVWTGGLVLDLAIGQAQVTTPLQLAVMVSSLGNAKHQYRPHLVKEIRSHDGTLVKKIEPEVQSTFDLKPETITALHEGMKSVMEAGGTGGRASVPGIAVGGKTGSAQNPQGDLTHALFVAVAPLDDPVIAIAVVLENAGHGGAMAAPVAGQILRHWFMYQDEGIAVMKKYNPSFVSPRDTVGTGKKKP